MILGIGVGGDYPISSIITSEFATVKWRGAMIAAVFANQGFGQFTAVLITFLCIIGFQNSLHVTTCDEGCQSALDKAWRIIYGFGALPAVVAVYFRLTIPETVRFTLDVENDANGAAADAEHYVSGKFGPAPRHTQKPIYVLEDYAPPKASFHDFVCHFRQWKNGKVLVGTALSWFLLDVAFVISLIARLMFSMALV